MVLVILRVLIPIAVTVLWGTLIPLAINGFRLHHRKQHTIPLAPLVKHQFWARVAAGDFLVLILSIESYVRLSHDMRSSWLRAIHIPTAIICFLVFLTMWRWITGLHSPLWHVRLAKVFYALAILVSISGAILYYHWFGF